MERKDEKSAKESISELSYSIINLFNQAKYCRSPEDSTLSVQRERVGMPSHWNLHTGSVTCKLYHDTGVLELSADGCDHVVVFNNQQEVRCTPR